MKPRGGLRYEDVGVLTNDELGLGSLLSHVRRTEALRKGKAGESILDIGYFANVIRLGHGLGLAMTTDGVGTKVLIAQMLDRYDTIGIDCVAMNVNDLICVGAEPVSMLDYIALEKADERVLSEIGAGLAEGCRQAGVNIVGGEISQIRDMLRGERHESGLDLVGMCIGLVAEDRVNVGQNVAPGDLIIGLRSSGIHSNGLTLARHVLFELGQLKATSHVDELGQSVGDELLRPTRIYVREVLDLLGQAVPLKAMINITSDGFLNLCRVKPDVGFELDRLPEPQPIFDLIQKTGAVTDAEMHRVFNMGVGFCLVVAPEPAAVRAVHETARRHGVDSYEIGVVTDDARRRVHIPAKRLVGEGDRFFEGSTR